MNKIPFRISKFTCDSLAFSESFWSVLAFLRFILAAIVFIGHLNSFTRAMPSVFTNIMLLGGKASVVCFLLISGISIGHSYAKSEAGYFQRRFLRIYPLYFFAVLFALFLQYFLGSPFYTPGRTMVAAGLATNLANFFFLQGILSITITYNGPLWSLGVEVFFYMLVPFLKKISTWALYVIIILSMLAFLFLHPKKELLWGYPAFIYAWPWVIGFLISTRKHIKGSIILLLSGTISVYFNKSIMTENLSCITFLLCSIITLICMQEGFHISKKLKTVFNFLGELSYPLYLFHLPIYLILYYWGIRSPYFFIFLLLLIIVPTNYVLDNLLKKIFWKPLVKFINVKLDSFRLLKMN